MTTTEPADLLDKLLTGGGSTAKFKEIGATVRGRVVAAEPRQARDYDSGKPKVWDNGDPVMEVVVTLDTGEEDENGNTFRTLYLGGKMLQAVRQALAEARSKLVIGGELAVKYIGDGEPSKKGFNPPKLYKAKYTPPTPGAVDLDDL